MQIRRTGRAPLTALAAVSLALALPGTAQAHGDTLKVVVTGHRQGHVTTTVTWENDGDPVGSEEPLAAMVNAVSADGSRVAGPWRLVHDGTDPAAWTTEQALPAGTWRVTVEAGYPALGRAETRLTVAAPAAGSGPSAGPGAATPAGASAAPALPSAAASQRAVRTPVPPPGRREVVTESHDRAWWTTAGVAVAALLGAGAGAAWRRRRGGSR
ncbi:hypothetical protein [Streptomyces sp. NPDC089919]|uniref:hypothetical protein n=1 Tax=Streptomyces sp. NPDC089919 TaxID=3155188 RepID=UPI003428E882